MNDFVHQQLTTNDLVAHAVPRDLNRLVLIGDKGERITAGEMRDAGDAITKPFAKPGDDLIAAVRCRKGAVQAPKSVSFVDALPLSAVGKPDKKALRAQFAGDLAG